MKKENYEKATPIIEELNKLINFKLPEVEVNEATNNLEAKKPNKLGGKLDFGNYNGIIYPVIKRDTQPNYFETIVLNENEYNKIKDVFNEVIEARINDCETKLDKL